MIICAKKDYTNDFCPINLIVWTWTCMEYTFSLASFAIYLAHTGDTLLEAILYSFIDKISTFQGIAPNDNFLEAKRGLPDFFLEL